MAGADELRLARASKGRAKHDNTNRYPRAEYSAYRGMVLRLGRIAGFGKGSLMPVASTSAYGQAFEHHRNCVECLRCECSVCHCCSRSPDSYQFGFEGGSLRLEDENENEIESGPGSRGVELIAQRQIF